MKIVFLPVSPPRTTGPLVRPGSTGSVSTQAIQESFGRARPGAAEGPQWERRIPRERRGRRGEAQPALRERSHGKEREHRHRHPQRSQLRQAPTTRYHCWVCFLFCAVVSAERFVFPSSSRVLRAPLVLFCFLCPLFLK